MIGFTVFFPEKRTATSEKLIMVMGGKIIRYIEKAMQSFMDESKLSSRRVQKGCAVEASVI